MFEKRADLERSTLEYIKPAHMAPIGQSSRVRHSMITSIEMNARTIIRRNLTAVIENTPDGNARLGLFTLSTSISHRSLKPYANAASKTQVIASRYSCKPAVSTL